MHPHWFTLALPLALLYALFLRWWGGRSAPMTPSEIEDRLLVFQQLPLSAHDREMLPALREFALQDDGRAFVMQNLVKYRPRALYPADSPYAQDDISGVAADRRYGRRVLWPLLKVGSLPLFIARRQGRLVEPAGSDDWQMVAMVRYRSRRDFLRFALAITGDDIAIHKWAAIEKTHVFPVVPFISLFAVRVGVALALTCLGLMLHILLSPALA